MDNELLEEHHEGLIALSGCTPSEVAAPAGQDRFEDAVKAARYYKDLFGDFYIELQEHGITEHEPLNGELYELAQETGLPLVATNDVHYVNHEDAPSQDILLCIGTNSSSRSENRFKMAGEFGLLLPEVGRGDAGAVPGAPGGDATTRWRIAEMCDLITGVRAAAPPEGGGAAGRYGRGAPGRASAARGWRACTPGSRRRRRGRLEYELDVVRQTGFADYILVVQDFAQYARRAGHPDGGPRIGGGLDHPLLPRRDGHRPAGAPAGVRALPERRAAGDAGR